MATWPATLPQSLSRRGYEEAEGDNVIRTTVDAGPQKRRPRFTAVVRPLQGTMVFTNAQLETFRTFFKTDAFYGALGFTFPDQRGTGTEIVVFASPPRWANVGGDNYRISLDLEIQP